MRVMKLLNTNWVEMLDVVCLWEELRLEDKEYFLFKMEPGVTDADGVPVDTADSLASCGLISVSASGEKLSFTRTGNHYHRIFHALYQLRNNENEVIDIPLGRVIAYLKMFYTRKEREEITRLKRNNRWEETDLAIQVSGAAWAASFLRCRDVSEWETGFPIDSNSDDPKIDHFNEVFVCAKNILRKIISHPVHWMQFGYMPLLVPECDYEIVIEAFTLLLENMLIFVNFSSVDLSFYVHLPLPIYKFLNPDYFKPQELVSHSWETFQVPPFRLHDTVELLVEAARNPLPVVKSTGKLYARSEKELSDRMISLPEHVPFRKCYTPHKRICSAILEARILEYGGIVTQKGKLFFTVTESGKQWLKGSFAEKLKAILEKHIPPRFDLKRDCFNRDVWGKGTSIMFSFEAVRKINFSHFVETDLTESLYHTLQNLADTVNPVTLESFLGYQCEQNNPLAVLFHSGAPLLNKQESETLEKKYVVEEQEMESLWRQNLEDYLRETVIPLGLLNTAFTKAGNETTPVIELSSAGRFFAGDSDVFELEEPETNPVVVQPDFMIRFDGTNTVAEIALSSFTHRTGFSSGCLLKITSSSVYSAVGDGATSDRMLSLLSQYSHGRVPANVSEAIVTWASECRWITADSGVVLKCPDEETASLIVDLAGCNVERLSPVALSVTNRKVLKKLMKLLEQKGIFLNS
ncbi:hypothetical protein CSA37_01435 [Candidatus Fermentibacteria bacterium]|nr:MAG: hypothetical protein CSA37_01435 [Candidatus Fermentibacteria bacterium]